MLTPENVHCKLSKFINHKEDGLLRNLQFKINDPTLIGSLSCKLAASQAKRCVLCTYLKQADIKYLLYENTDISQI